MLNEPKVPLTKSSIEAEIRRIHREAMYDLAAGGAKKVDALTEELKNLLDYVERNDSKIQKEEEKGKK